MLRTTSFGAQKGVDVDGEIDGERGFYGRASGGGGFRRVGR